MTNEQIDTIRVELSRRAASAQPRQAHFVVGKDGDFCGPCASATAGHLEVCREHNSDSDILRWCETCGALLDYRIGPEEAEKEVAHFEVIPPSTPEHWAELLHTMAEVPPEDWRTTPVEPSSLWVRVEALLGPV